MSAHTSGPWHPGCFVDPDSKCQCSYIFSEFHAGSVAKVSVDNSCSIAHGGNDSPVLDEARANARLIAAAPDLLKALKDVVAISDRKHNAWDAAKAAIRKAEGAT